MPVQGRMFRCVELSIPRRLDQRLEEMIETREMTREQLYVELLELAVMQLRAPLEAISPWKAAPDGTEFPVAK